MLWILQRVFHREHATPGVSVQDEALETERLAHLLDLLAITIDGPQRNIIRGVREPTAELIVVPEADARLRQKVLEALEIEMVEARPPAQGEHRDGSSADLLHPHIVSTIDAHSPGAAGKHAVCAKGWDSSGQP